MNRKKWIALGLALLACLLGVSLNTASLASAASQSVTIRPPSYAPATPWLETVKPATTSLHKAKGVPVRPMVTYEGIHTVDGNFAVNNAEDWDVDVTWYWDTNECGIPSDYCWVPKYVQTFYPGIPNADFKRLDADYVIGAGGGSLVQRIANASAGSTAPVATFTTGSWYQDSVDPRVNAKLTQANQPGLPGSNAVTHSTIRN